MLEELWMLFTDSWAIKMTWKYAIYGTFLYFCDPMDPLNQWFPTGVPQHTRVPQKGARGASGYQIFKDIRPI